MGLPLLSVLHQLIKASMEILGKENIVLFLYTLKFILDFLTISPISMLKVLKDKDLVHIYSNKKEKVYCVLVKLRLKYFF